MASPQLLVLCLVVFLVPLSGCIAPGANTATHHWRVEIAPADDEPYTVEVPFFVMRPNEDDISSLDALRSALRAVPDADLEWTGTDNGSVRITAQGPVMVEAKRSFQGTIGEREAFLDWRMASTEVRSLSGGDVSITMTIDHSGGSGHTCWMQAGLQADVPAGESGDLTGVDEPSWPEDGGIPAECA